MEELIFGSLRYIDIARRKLIVVTLQGLKTCGFQGEYSTCDKNDIGCTKGWFSLATESESYKRGRKSTYAIT